LADDRNSTVRQVREANDIVAVVGGYIALTPAGKQFKGICPFHEDSRPSLQVDPQWQNFRCWACGKRGSVFDFVMAMEKVDFREALTLLARRAGIALDAGGPNPARVRQLEVMRWACDRYKECLFESPIAESARLYLGERKLTGETVRRFELGFAPASGDWLLQLAQRANMPLDVLVDVGLVGKRAEGSGHYDRFRDRVMFPIRNIGGQVVGFGGRVLPNSPLATSGPKYYNSTETPLFSKSELLFGMDLAKQAATSSGFLAVVEGYTDVMMAHQLGVSSVVATMGTALTAKHIQTIRRFVPRIVLVYDADAGGKTGVDRALEMFANQNMELAIATLPEGLDPCDLLVQKGPEPFKRAIANAIDILDYKLNETLTREAGHGIEGQRRTIDAVLGILALRPDDADPASRVKQELIITRIAHRLGVQLDTIWARLRELRARRADDDSRREPKDDSSVRSAPASAHERQLLELLLSSPELVAEARNQIAVDEIEHPGLRYLLQGLYDLLEANEFPELDGLRPRLTNPRLAQAALELQEVGRQSPANRTVWLGQIVAVFDARRTRGAKLELRNQLTAAADHSTALDLLRQVQNKTTGSGR
jgi:DNA primase